MTERIVHLQGAAARAEFRRRSRRVNRSMMGMGAFAVVAAALFGGSVIGFEAMMGLVLGASVVHGIIFFRHWRCPQCEGRLYRSWPAEVCPHCRLVLDERMIAAYGEEKPVRDPFWTGISRDPGP